LSDLIVLISDFVVVIFPELSPHVTNPSREFLKRVGGEEQNTGCQGKLSVRNKPKRNKHKHRNKYRNKYKNKYTGFKTHLFHTCVFKAVQK